MHISEQKHTRFPNQGIKYLDEISYLMWANSYFPGDIIQNSIGIVVGNAKAFN